MLEDIRVTMISKIKELVDYSNTHSVPSTKQKEIELLRYVKGNNKYLKFNFFSTLQKYGTKWSFNKNDLERIY